MKTEETLSKGIIKRIVFITLVLVILLGIGVLAGTQSVNSVTIKFSDNTELTVITSKTNVNDILKENNIYIFEEEIVTPNFEENIDSNKTITITRKGTKNVQEVTEEKAIETTSSEVVESNEILNSDNETIVEKIVKETVEVPFETITKEVSTTAQGEKVNKVLQEGQNGIKEITYKIKYQNDVEIERTQISEQVIQEPVDKIVQVSVQVSNRSTMASRNLGAATASAAEAQAYAKQRCSAYGWSENDYYNLVALWNKESHWNMYAQNRYSGAYGIPQALPGSKMASAGSDYLTNYQTQVNWGLSYIKGRYGNPTVALYHSQATGWY